VRADPRRLELLAVLGVQLSGDRRRAASRRRTRGAAGALGASPMDPVHYCERLVADLPPMTERTVKHRAAPLQSRAAAGTNSPCPWRAAPAAPAQQQAGARLILTRTECAGRPSRIHSFMARAQPDWINDAERALSLAGYRRGGARRAVLDLLDAQACALSALEIEDLLRTRERSVSRASIYRILEELERLGTVQRVDLGRSLVRYEAVRGDTGHHHHLVCDHCGALRPFSDPELERTMRRLSQRVPLAVSDHEVVLHGACADCEPN